MRLNKLVLIDRFKASDIGASLYKIRDDSVKLRHFLGADNENEIEAILSDREGHFLHEYINDDEPLWPIIDFDLPIEILDAITPKLSDKQ
ncbi:10537_t:CDS:2, partial [Funneliformis geosporum]